MSNTSIQLKKSGQTGNTPPSLAYGEVALNYAEALKSAVADVETFQAERSKK